ncbi:MAG: PAS domain S-box protein [Bacteroidetes bacterium]|nr:PAS domain S-box protein [Bacteroidota bacterium]
MNANSKTYKNFIIVIAVIVITLGITVVIGWILDVSVLKQIVPSYGSFKFNAALCSILLGFSLILILNGKNSVSQVIFVLLTFIVFVIGVLSYSQYVFNYNLGIDEVFVRDFDSIAANRYYPGRMSPAAAISFILMGLAFFGIKSGKKMYQTIAQYSLHVVTIISFCALTGYLYGIPQIYRSSYFTVLALHAALTYFFLSIAAALINPTVGLSNLFTGNKIGNIMARSLFLWITISVLILGYIRLLMYRYSVLNDEFGIALYGISFILISLFLIQKTARELNKIDFKKTKAEEELEKRTNEVIQNEKRFRALIENSNEVIIVSDIDGNRLFVSEGINHMLGYTPEEYMKLNIFDMVSAERKDSVKQVLQKIIDNPRQPFTINVNVQHKNGSWHWIEAVLAGFLDVPGLNGIVVNYRDITERKKDEDAIRSAEANYREIFENATDAIYIHEIDTGKLIEVNQRACELTGYTKEGLLATSPHDFITGHPDYTFEKAIEYLQKAAMGTPQLFEWQGKKKDGSFNWFEVNLKKAIIAGEERVLAFFREINDRKNTQEKIQRLNEELEQKVIERTAQLEDNIRNLQESEEKFLKAFVSSAAGMSITRISDTKYIEVNNAFIQMTGYSKEELIGRTSTELGFVLNIEKREEVLKQLKERGSVGQFELTAQHKSGKIIEVLSSIETIILNGEKYAINIIFDISDRKKAEKQLEAANKELEAFSYSVSHDLRAPLRAIDGYTKILEEDYEKVFDNEGRRLLSIVQKNAQKMGNLIDDLLAFSRLGKKEIQKTSINMNELVEEVLEDLNKSIKHNAIVTIHNLHPVHADYALFRQVFTNLISNGIKYSSKTEKPVVEISSEEAEGNIVYVVKDNGVGFDMNYVNKLFGVFQRLHRSEDFEGTGVGLAIVHRIVNRHGGKVWAEGALNEGAAFYFSVSSK